MDRSLHPKHSQVKFVVSLLILWLAALPLLSLLRLAAPAIGIDQHMLGQGANIVNAVFFSFALYIATSVALQALRRARLSPFLVGLICAETYGVIIGVLNNGWSLDSVKHIYLFAFAYSFLEIGRLAVLSLDLERIRKVIRVCFWGNLISIPLFFSLYSAFGIYPGFGTQSAAYTAIFYLVFKNKLFFYLSFIIVVAQGKRSVLAALIVCWTIYKFAVIGKSRALVVSGIVFAPIFIAGLLFAVEYLDLYTVQGLARVEYINPFSPSFDAFLGSSGRYDEIFSSIKGLNEIAYSYVTGAGFGFSYDWELSYNEEFIENKSYVHNTPFMIFMLLGPVAAILFVVASVSLVVTVLASSNKLVGSSLGVRHFFALSALYFLVSGLFSLNMLSDPLGWVFLGSTFAFSRLLPIRTTNFEPAGGRAICVE